MPVMMRLLQQVAVMNKLINHILKINSMACHSLLMTITWSLAYVIIIDRINDDKIHTSFAGHFYGHDNVLVQFQAYFSMRQV
jgi:hypothetical protein